MGDVLGGWRRMDRVVERRESSKGGIVLVFWRVMAYFLNLLLNIG